MAVKIIRNVEKYRDAAKIEIEILEKIRKAGGCEVSPFMMSSDPLMASQLIDDVTYESLVQDLLTKKTGSFGGIRRREKKMISIKFAASQRWTMRGNFLKVA